MPVQGIALSGAAALAFFVFHVFWWRHSARGAADAGQARVCLAAG